MKINKLSRIIVSRTDSIGDVALTLPLCLWLKSNIPEATLVYLCKSYTKDFVQCFEPVDEILLLEDLENSDQNTRNSLLQSDLILHVFPNKKIASWAKQAGIQHRIGTSHRWFHWLNCNIRVSFTRKKSPLHEAQLNFNLLKPLGLETIPLFEEIKSLKDHFIIPTEPDFFPPGYVILHPLSQGSAINYPLVHYVALAEMLAKQGKLVLITGTAKEGIQIGFAFDHIAGVENVCGKFSLGGLMAFDMALEYPQEFSAVGVFSGSFWWRSKSLEKGYLEEVDRIMHAKIRNKKREAHLRFFLQTGQLDETADRNNNGIIDSIDDTMGIIEELKRIGYEPKEQITYLELPDGKHEVETWGRVMPMYLKWLNQLK